MASLAEIFNPTVLIFLGILFLVVALLVLYFESKMREQNHKIASMLSLVSTMAEEVNGINMRVNTPFVMPNMAPNMVMAEMGSKMEPTKESLITVSDDSEDESESDSDDSDINSDSSDSDSDNDNSTRDIEIGDDNIETIEIGNKQNDVKILKLNVLNDNKQDELDIDFENLNDEEEDTDEEDEEDDNDEDDDLSSKSSKSHDIMEETKEEENTNDFLKSLNLKTINMENLEQHKEPVDNSLDYKKMTIGKLRSIVSEKGLHEDPNKLKKQDLLKLLGDE